MAWRAASISQSLFAYSGEDDFFQCGLVGFANALEFAAGDDVEACSLLCQKSEDGERGVGFDGVADGVRASFGTVREGSLEELEALGDLIGGVDVERRTVFFGEGGEAGPVAMERAVAVDERTGIRDGGSDLFLANLGALCWKAVGFFRNDDPGDDIRDGADAGEYGYERGDDADDVEVPAVVESEARADSGDHAVGA